MGVLAWVPGCAARLVRWSVVSAAARRRAAAGLLAAVVVVAAGTGCDARTDRGPDPRPRTTAKATNPPPGLPAALTAGQRLNWSVCPAPSGAQGSGHAPGGGWECATMKAPLDYREPGRAAIDVALIRKRATGPERNRIGSLLFDFGGPGVSGVTGLPEFARDYTSLGQRYDLVGFDPRGVGGTIPIDCGQKAYEGGDVCKKRSGRFLPYVGTTRTARDLDLMRYLLGDQKLNYFGVSYGTELGGTYAHLFPENVGRLVLEAPVDPTQNLLRQNISQVRAVQSAFDRFARHCAATYDDCPTGSDPDRATPRVVDLLGKLDKTPATTGGHGKLDGDRAAHAISNYLDRGKEGWGPLVKALREVMDEGTGNQLMEKAYDHAPGARSLSGTGTHGEPTGGNGTSAFVAITCADSDLRPGFTRSERWIKDTEAASPVFGKAWSYGVYLCYDWPFHGERATPDVSAHGAAPILVVAGTSDPTTPYAGAGHMVSELGDKVGVLLTVRAEGHGTYPQNHCARRAVDTYLIAGKLPARGTTCS
ncbi:alpha/beta hydrolase [Streptomyces antnestii]|uniref:Alpha/beta hydrolase n=1 Tax=Streptomyces antnestii TaxID=2494256 RepID=A0A437P5Z5_9ACTN|nr:alpha/beta hydrolase [Streptomyces sp. San01]RVU17673.1 alpha/beta hydrolase [Streptomyces sp. San01]